MADGCLFVERCDIKQIALALSRDWSSVAKRARSNEWPYVEEKGRGGTRKLYLVEKLPAEVKRAVRHANAVAAAQATIASSPTYKEGARLGRRLAIKHKVDGASQSMAMEAGLAEAAGLAGAAAERMEARLEIVTQLSSYASRVGLGVNAALESFCAAYAAGEVGSEKARKVIGNDVSTRSIRRWQKTLKSKGAAGLAGAYGNREGTGHIDANPTLHDFAVGMVANTPHIGGKQLHRAISARFTDAHVPLRTVQRWLTEWKAKNRQLFTAIANPDAWKNQYMLALGNASEDVTRLNQRWEFDSTPGDIELTDGRHVLVGIIDVWSRRLMLKVAKTSSAEAVCTTLRRAILAWGVPECAKLDNGKDYVSNRVQGVFAGLGVEVRLSAPFSPWEKPHIERAFHTFSHDLLELLPGYLGHNVADRQALRAGQSFAERLFKKDTTAKLQMSAAELQAFCDQWCRDIYEQESRTGLDGDSIFQRVASSRTAVRRITNERALDLLLAEVPGKGERKVVKKGLRIDGHFYAGPELGALVGEPVTVFYDPDDLGRVIVYHEGKFACVAECPELLGFSRREVAIEAKAIQTKEIQAARRYAKTLGRKANTHRIVEDILNAKAMEQQALTQFPSPEVTHITPALLAAGEAAAALADADAPHSQRQVTQADVDLVVRMQRDEQRQDETAEDRFRRALRLIDQSNAVDEVQARWLKSYQTTSEFKGRWFVFEEEGSAAFGPINYDHLRRHAHHGRN